MERRTQRHFGGNAPIGNFEIYNATYIGAGTNSTGGRAFISREYAAPKVFNSIFTEFNAGGNIDDKSGAHFTNGVANFRTISFGTSRPTELPSRTGRMPRPSGC